MRIAVLFDGAGLARLGLERVGHECRGVELDPVAHYLGTFVGAGKCIKADVLSDEAKEIIMWADAVWASPPCQTHSAARTQGEAVGEYATDLLEWSLNLGEEYPHLKHLWVENVVRYGKGLNQWGTKYNAAQFKHRPLQNRQRVVGGFYPTPTTYREFKPHYHPELDICPCVTTTEYKGCATDTRRASRFYKRRLTLNEVGKHMGMPGDWAGNYVPYQWETKPEWFRDAPHMWRQAQYRALGNGVPIWMAEAFGRAVKDAENKIENASGTWEVYDARLEERVISNQFSELRLLDDWIAYDPESW